MVSRNVVTAGLHGLLLAGCGGGSGEGQGTHPAAPVTTAPATNGGGASISVPRASALRPWSVDSANVVPVRALVTVGGVPVRGVRLRVDGYELPPTNAEGRAVYLADANRLARHVVTVGDASTARVRDSLLAADARQALEQRAASITVAYTISDLRAGRDARGNPTVSGRISYADGTAPPVVSQYSYELAGTVTDAKGRPVVGARVSTRTADRDYWSVSTPTDEHGRYSSLFTASSERGGNPVPFDVRVSRGDLVHQFLPEETVAFQRLKSARLDIRLPPHGYAVGLPVPRSYPGAIYEGIVVGAAVGAKPVRPLIATWPDARGRFQLTLPRALAGRAVTLWEAKLNLFSRAAAAPGGPIDLRDWPAALQPDMPQELARIGLS